jgi:quercetin dioxygenase-like cupin family protein
MDMRVIRFTALESGKRGLEKIYQSAGGQTRLIEGVFAEGEEIGPHTHPAGEDCAMVLSGVLTYWISNRETIGVRAGEVVFGWENVIHGYRNDGTEPVHVLIFATPAKTGLCYPDDGDPGVWKLQVEERKLNPDEAERSAESAYSRFSYVTISGSYEEEQPEGQLTVFVDWQERTAYLFDGEPIRFSFSGTRRFLKYVARS